MQLAGFMHQAQHSTQDSYVFMAVGLAYGLALVCLGCALAVTLLTWWLVEEWQGLRQEVKSMRRQCQDCQALHKQLAELLEQSDQWNHRIAALYPSLADLLDDKLSQVREPNGRYES